MLRAQPSLVLLAALCVAASGCHAEPQAAAAPAHPATNVAPIAASGMRLQATADMPTPRAAHSANRLPDGRVLLAGGCSANGCEEGIAGDALLFDPGNDTFLPAGNLVQPRVGHRAVALADGSVLLFGGYTADGPTTLVERYVPATGRFETHGRMLEARDGFSATLLADGSILIAGGYAAGMQRLASAERYDPATGHSVAVGAMAAPRMSHTATLLDDGRVLVAGGSRSSRDVLDTLELFDPARNVFSDAGKMQRSRHKHAAIARDGRVLLLGGATIPEADGHFSDSEWWSADGIVPGPRMAHGRYKFLDTVIALTDGQVLVAGGGSQAEVLASDGMAFHAVDGTLGERLAFASATLLADGRVLVVGGYDPDIRVSRKAWLLTQSPRTAAASPNED